MNNFNKNYRNDDRKEDVPPHSRLFVVCSKNLREEDLQGPFEAFGEIDDLYIPRDRNTRDSRGVAYIKYKKTSSAATAIQEMNLKTLPNTEKPLKVMIASSNKGDRNDSLTKNAHEKFNRLFIKIPRQTTEEDIRKQFSEYGAVESVYIQRDKVTQESKGLAYVQFKSFYDAAKAYEECDKHFKAVFAAPKQELKRSRDGKEDGGQLDPFNDHHYNPSSNRRDNIGSLISTNAENYRSVCVTCSPALSQRHLQRLFNIIPGMLQFQFTEDTYNGFSRALVSYDDERAAAYAVEKLHNYEFPSGEVVTVKPDNPLSKAANDLTTIVNSFKNAVDAGNPDLVQLADAIAHASTLIKAATSGRIETRPQPDIKQEYCSVRLPPVQPLAPPNSRVVQRCFVVCYPHPPPVNVLRDIFCRFGDFIDISSFPNKTFVFAKYASAGPVEDAIRTLHGATVTGIRLKVLEADEKNPHDTRSHVDSDHGDNNMDIDMDRKRMRLHDKI